MRFSADEKLKVRQFCCFTKLHCRAYPFLDISLKPQWRLSFLSVVFFFCYCCCYLGTCANVWWIPNNVKSLFSSAFIVDLHFKANRLLFFCLGLPTSGLCCYTSGTWRSGAMPPGINSNWDPRWRLCYWLRVPLPLQWIGPEFIRQQSATPRRKYVMALMRTTCGEFYLPMTSVFHLEPGLCKQSDSSSTERRKATVFVTVFSGLEGSLRSGFCFGI